MYTHRPDRQSGSPRRIRLVALAGSNASDVLVSALPPILRATLPAKMRYLADASDFRQSANSCNTSGRVQRSRYTARARKP